MSFLESFLAILVALGTGAVVAATTSDAHAQQPPRPAREVTVVVDRGYQPARVVITAGERVRLRFVRREYTPCTREVVIPSLNIRRELPPNQPVTIDLPALPAGEIEFHCGMNMVRGTIEVQPHAHH